MIEGGVRCKISGFFGEGGGFDANFGRGNISRDTPIFLYHIFYVLGNYYVSLLDEYISITPMSGILGKCVISVTYISMKDILSNVPQMILIIISFVYL